MGMTDNDINQFNLQMRAQPWYQQWFAERGLNPNQVKLNDRQQEELKRTIEQRAGFKFPGDMKIDPAGNLNEKGGWAGLPTWAKVAIIGGAAVATGGALGAFGGAGGATSGGAAATTAGAPSAAGSIAGSIGATGATTAGTLGSTAAVASPGIFSRIGQVLNSPVATAAGRMISGATDAAANNRGAEIEARFGHDALRIADSKNARDLETDDYRKSLFGQLASSYTPSARPAGAEGRNPQGFTTPESQEAGRLMSEIARKRLAAQNYSQITPYSELPVKPGTMERIGNWLGPGLSLFDPRVYQR